MNLNDYFLDGHELSVDIKTSLDIDNGDELVEAISDYFTRYWYSEFRIKAYTEDRDLIYIELRCVNGYEGEIELYYEDKLVKTISDEEEAIAEIEKCLTILLNTKAE